MSQAVLDQLGKLANINSQHVKITAHNDPLHVLGYVDSKGKIHERVDSHSFKHVADITPTGVRMKNSKALVGKIGADGTIYDHDTVAVGKVDKGGNIFNTNGHVIGKSKSTSEETLSAGAAAMLLLMQKKQEHQHI